MTIVGAGEGQKEQATEREEKLRKSGRQAMTTRKADRRQALPRWVAGERGHGRGPRILLSQEVLLFDMWQG